MLKITHTYAMCTYAIEYLDLRPLTFSTLTNPQHFTDWVTQKNISITHD